MHATSLIKWIDGMIFMDCTTVIDNNIDALTTAEKTAPDNPKDFINDKFSSILITTATAVLIRD